MTDLYPYFKTISESIVILSSDTVYCSRVDAKTFWMGFHDSIVPLVFVQCQQVKFRPKKKVKIKVFHSVVMVCVCVGGGGGGGGAKAVKHDMNFCNFFNLIIFTISNKA